MCGCNKKKMAIIRRNLNQNRPRPQPIQVQTPIVEFKPQIQPQFQIPVRNFQRKNINSFRLLNPRLVYTAMLKSR